MDRYVHNAERRYFSEPTKENAEQLKIAYRRIGSPLGNSLVFDVHIAAEKCRASTFAGQNIFSHSTVLLKSFLNYSLRFPFSGAIYAGLAREDIEDIYLILDVGDEDHPCQSRIPNVIWSPSGNKLHTIVDSWYSELEIIDYLLVSKNSADEYVKELVYFPLHGGVASSRYSQQVDVSEDVSKSSILEGPFIGPPSIMATGASFAELAYEAGELGSADFIPQQVITSLKDFKNQFALWLAMEHRGWI